MLSRALFDDNVIMKPLAPNTMIQNRYLIVHLIGKGGMGEVYLSVDQRLGNAVALKRTFFADDETLGNAFEREAKILARLRHPVLPKVSDHFMENGEQYLVMEHISGDDLSKRLEGAQKPFPLSWVMFWADQLLDALTYLHSHEPPIIHRDIKPQNLKLTDENHIVLLDFGLSKDSAIKTKTDPAATSGSVVGYTPHFASMEQIRGTGTNARSDIYSLSATLYQLMTNTVPSDALGRADALLSGLPDPIIALSEINPEIPQVVSDVILKGIEVSQEKRYATAAEMQKVLRRGYKQTQEAMSAQTAVFGMEREPAFKSGDAVTDPAGVALDSAPMLVSPIQSVPSEMPTQMQSKSDEESMDATLQMNPAEAESVMKQADVKTEVLLAGDLPFIPDIEEPPPILLDEPLASTFTDEVPAVSDYPPSSHLDESSGFEPAATTPVISLGDVDQPASPEFFTSPNIEPTEEPPIPYQPQPARQPTPKKSSSKAGLILGGLGGLFLLVLMAGGAGWYLYDNYYASATESATPTPLPSFETSPSPEPTTDTLAESNANVDANSQADGGDNSNSSDGRDDLTVAPTPSPTPGAFAVTRPTPQAVTKNTPARTTQTPTAKTTPKPKPNDNRTVILQ